MSRALLAIVLCLFTAVSWADERILDYRSDIRVNADSSLDITETLRVRAEGRDIRRGIYRDFPTRYRDRFGNHVQVEFLPLSVLRNGQSEAWHSEERSNGVRVYAGSASRLLEPGIHEYRLAFRTNRQLGYFRDHDELYFNAVGTGWAFPIDHAEVTVTLPFDVRPEQLELHAYMGFYGSKEQNASKTMLPDGRIRFETTRGLAPGEGLTVSVSWPKGRVAEPGAEQKARWFLNDNGAAIVLIAGLLAVLAWYAWAWNRVGRDPAKGVIIPRFQPPGGLSPAACRYVLSMSFNRDAFTAAIISLAVKGQVQIDEDGKEFSLRRRSAPPRAELTPGERAVLESLLPHAGASVEMKNENHKAFREARSALSEALRKEYKGRLFLLNGIYLLPPLLFTIGAAVIAAFLPGSIALWIAYVVLSLAAHGLFAFLMRAPTPAGRVVMDEIEGFRIYLETGERDRLERMRSPELTPEVFEAFLPYAYALGVENKWCNRFAREMPREMRQSDSYHPAWYNGRLHGIGALHHLGDDFSSSFSTAIASASSPPGSSSGSGGGGFSGGGGGGGGGGGW
jgi:uncharacterized membrane protein YgcG